MDLGIKGKKALVMGASAGLGYAIAEALLAEGVDVAICSRAGDKLDAAKTKLGVKTAVPIDLTQPHAGEAVIKAVGNIDILVTNTGGPAAGSFADITTDAWQAGFQSLWLSAVDAIKASLPHMRAQKWGRILLVTSVAAREPMANLTVSNGLRAGLLGLTKSIANEIASDGVTINALLPGYTATERLQQLNIPAEKMAAQIPARRIGRPEEFAALAAFLASAQASYITGQAIAVDGGYQHSI
jgi:3-oxoacyl-[acyl-carrier protein] reductase